VSRVFKSVNLGEFAIRSSCSVVNAVSVRSSLSMMVWLVIESNGEDSRSYPDGERVSEISQTRPYAEVSDVSDAAREASH
jgi:hypothetical protein